MHRLSLKNRIKWRKGSGELIGFAIILPIVVLFIITILSTAKISNAKQRLTYMTYTVARAMCVSSNEERAINRGDAIMAHVFGDTYTGCDYAHNGTSSFGTDYVPFGTPTYIRDTRLYANLLGDKWENGTILEITISQSQNSLMPLSKITYSQSLAVMVESGGEVDEDSPGKDS